METVIDTRGESGDEDLMENKFADPESLMQVKFRVVALCEKNFPRKVLLLSSRDYASCEKFIWAFTGPYTELEIQKVWVKK